MPDRKMKAFISTSLRKEDEKFCDLVIDIVKENNFEPFGTIGKFSQSPQSLFSHMIENIQKSDCVVLVATPRYIQIDIHDPSKKDQSISELVQSEGIIATVCGKPVLIFAEEGVSIGSIFKNNTQYIELKSDGSDRLSKSQRIKDYFENTLKLIEKNKHDLTQQKQKPAVIFKGEKSLFVGRQKEIENLSDMVLNIHSTNPIAVVGIGGIGKSSLCHKLIHSCEKFFDSILSINGEVNLSFNAFLLKIGNYIIPPQDVEQGVDTDQYREKILQAIGNLGRTLIYLDNYDTMDIPQIHNFLEEVPKNVKIIISSRNKTNLTGEEIFEIDGLEIEDGVKLFLQITKKFFKKTASIEFVNSLKNILKDIECHPLSIKLLAGSYHGGGISELEHVKSLLLKIRNANETGLYRSIQACLDFSFNKLTKKQKNSLLGLVFFTSPFSKEAAKYVENVDEAYLYELYDKSWIRRNEIDLPAGTGENIFLYEMHPVVRKYLEQRKLSRDEKLELKKLSEFYYNFVIDAYREIGKVGKHGYYSGIINIITGEISNDIDIAMNQLEKLRDRSFMCNKLAQTLHQIGHPYRAINYYLKNLIYDSRDGNAVRVGNDYQNIGNFFEQNHEYGNALAYHLNSKQNYEKGGDEIRKLDAEIHIISCLFNLGKIDPGYKRLKNIHASISSLENKISRIQYYITLVPFIGAMKSYFEIKKNYICALACRQKITSPLLELGDHYLLGDHYVDISSIFAKFGDTKNAIKHLKLAFSTYEKINDMEHMFFCSEALREVCKPVDKTESENFRVISENIKNNSNYDPKKPLFDHHLPGRELS